MFNLIACFIILAVQLVASEYFVLHKVIIGEYTRHNACIGGGIEVRSTPANLPVTNDNCNVKYDKKEWQLKPSVRYPDAKDGTFYAIIMIDPDAPNLADGEYYLHWLYANVEGTALKNGSMKDAGSSISKYQGPAPPEGTGDHKYQFLIYRQEEDPFESLPDVVLVKKLSDKKRYGFNLTHWLKKQRKYTKLVGPITGAQFISNFEGT